MPGLEPWEGEINCPLLCINSEEFSVSDDYGRMLDQIVPTCKDEHHLLSIAGATHPSFSDVFLIIPGRSEQPSYPFCRYAHPSRELDGFVVGPVSGLPQDYGSHRPFPRKRRRRRVDQVGHVQARDSAERTTQPADRACRGSVLPDELDPLYQ